CSSRRCSRCVRDSLAVPPSRGSLPLVDLRRVRTWEWVTGLAGGALLVSLFLPWYGAGDVTASAWAALSVIDVLLALTACGAIGLLVVAATQRTPSVPQSWATLLVWVAIMGAIVALIRLLNLPDGGAVGFDEGG